MSEEANGAAGLVAEIERLRTDNAELRARRRAAYAARKAQLWRAIKG